MTDERQGDALWDALERLPPGGGVIFRHYATPGPERRALFERVRRIARRRRLLLVLAGTPRDAAAWRADGAHGVSSFGGSRPLVRTAPAHNRRQLITAQRSADLVLLSPVFPTRSHPGAKPLGPLGFADLARRAKSPVIALGGMTERRARRLHGHYGWAAIDAWSLGSPR
jgi:thiamine-phosphate pyrophosphorylase